MKLPILNELPATREMIEVFGGYNHNLRISDGEFFDMKNLTSTDYPVLSPRPQRGIYAYHSTAENIPSGAMSVTIPQGMLEKNNLVYVDGENIVIDGYPIDMDLSIDSTPKQLISMGSYIIIMPDKKYINTTNYGDKGNIEASFQTHGRYVSFSLCRADGTTYVGATTSDTAPENPADGAFWIDTSDNKSSLKQYSEANKEWISIATTYVRIDFDQETGVPFKEGDGVTISGITDENLLDFNGTMVIQAAGNDYIVVIGMLDRPSRYITDEIFITRRMPEMDFIIESENRLWGCHYGFDIQGNFVNEIYASKLGDFKNWNAFAGISTDSYVASVGTDGFFTGAITHLGYPVFFKENCMHKVYGNYPANYQIQTTTCRGVQKGSEKSLAIVNEVLYYKSRNAVCAYDGSLPVEISSALGDVSYHNAAAGSISYKYYISMADDNNEYHLFVYDTKRGLWHREDNTHAVEFCTCQGELYYIDDGKCIKTMSIIPNVSYPYEGEVPWSVETGVIGTDSPDKKYISRLDVRMMLTVGTRVYFYIEYDSSGKWEPLFTMTGRTLKSFPVSIRPHRCDHMRLRIEGDGVAKIFSICKTIEQGSDI